MPSKRKRWRRGILFYPSIAFFHIIRWLPLPVARSLGLGLAHLAFYAVPRIRKVGRANLDLAYGDSLSASEKEHILRGAVRNLGLVAVEFSRMASLTQAFIDRHVTIKGLSNMEPGKGAVMVSAHLGNWEWFMPAGISLGFDVIIVVREFDNPRMNTFIDGVRRATGVRTISKDAAMGPLLRKVREGALVGLLADQSPRDNGVPVTFFGQRTWATAGPALVAMRARVPMHPVSMTRNDNGAYTLEFFPAIPMIQTGDLLHDLEENTQRCQDAVETMIRNHPEQWLWFHRRWKPRERLATEWAARKNRRQAGTRITDQEQDSHA